MGWFLGEWIVQVSNKHRIALISTGLWRIAIELWLDLPSSLWWLSLRSLVATLPQGWHHYLILAPDSWLYVSGIFLPHYNSFTRCPANGLGTNKGITIYSSKSRPLVSGMLANQLLVRLDSTDSCRIRIGTNAST